MKRIKVHNVFKLLSLVLAIFTVSNVAFALTAQTIVIDMATPATAINGSTFSVGGISDSGLPVSISVTGGCSTTSPVILDNGIVTMTSDSDSCIVHYNQAGDSNFDPAGEVTETIGALPANNAITSTPSSPEVVITNPTQTVTITVDSTTTNATLNVSSFISSGTGTLPEINITASNANDTVVEIPASTVVTSTDNTWNGIIAVPTITTVSLPQIEGETKTLGTAIEVGFSGAKLSFNKAVRLLLTNQAGKNVGYIRTGIDFTEITNTCSADNQTSGDALGADGECKIDVGSDLVIWTKHFTSFATYTQKTNSIVGSYANPIAPIVPIVPVVLDVPVKIEGCDDRTTGFSTITGQSCNNATGQVLGAEKFNFTLRLRAGKNGNEVTELQKLLTTLGYDVGKADGKFGPKTKAGLIKFQIANNLKGDGIVGANTRALLNK